MLRVACLVALSLVPTWAAAGSIFLNGVNIDGVVNQTFQNATITIDANGNIFISAKGYTVEPPVAQQPTAPAKDAAPPQVPAAVTQRYWLVTEKAAPGMTQYDVELYVNAKFVRKFLDEEEHVVLEITKYLAPGPNKIVFIARKHLGKARRSSSPQHYFRIVVGEGDSGGRNVMINKKLIDYKRTALETKEVIEDTMTLTTR